VEGLKIQNNLKLDPSHANGEGRVPHMWNFIFPRKKTGKRTFKIPVDSLTGGSLP
jgi:hypothetical protein